MEKRTASLKGLLKASPTKFIGRPTQRRNVVRNQGFEGSDGGGLGSTFSQGWWQGGSRSIRQRSRRDRGWGSF